MQAGVCLQCSMHCWLCLCLPARVFVDGRKVLRRATWCVHICGPCLRACNALKCICFKMSLHCVSVYCGVCTVTGAP